MLSRQPALQLLTSILMCGLLTSCSNDSNKTLSDGLVCTDEVSGIVNGHIAQKADALSSSTVLLITENKKQDLSVCTGTLIEKNIVLTAAHCSAHKMYVTFVRNVGCLGKMTKIPARAVTRSLIRRNNLPEDLNLASDDLMLLRFDGSAPQGFYPRALPEKNLRVTASDTLLMAGYGRTTEKAEDSGVLRFTETSAHNLLGNIYFPHSNQYKEVERALILDQRRTGVCQGDSGGPLYIKSPYGLTLIGVTSLGVDNTSANSKGEKVCQGVALFTDVRAHLDWIREGIISLRRAAY